MQFTIDMKSATVCVQHDDGRSEQLALGTPEAFSLLSRAWVRSSWENKYSYSFAWQGRPIVQLPEDMIRIQEVLYAVRPDVIIETGVAHGGSLVYYATLCQAMGRGRVVGVDIHIRPHNRQAIEAHRLASYITLLEGSSIDPAMVAQVRAQVRPGETVIVLLDSNHTKDHVLAELEAYAPLVSVGSYIVAMDGVMSEVVGAARTQPDWSWNNPTQAALEFVRSHSDFVIEEPTFPFNEGAVAHRITYWPSGFVKRLRA